MLREIYNLLLAELGNSYWLLEDGITLVRDEQTNDLKLIDTINGNCSAYCQPEQVCYGEIKRRKSRR